MHEATARFPANFDNLSRVLGFVTDAAMRAGLTPDQCRRVELVIEELFTNTVNYGYSTEAQSCSESEAEVWLAASETAQGLEVIYEDAASPFDPTGVDSGLAEMRVARGEIGGLGRVLVNTLPASVKYIRESGRNRLVLQFER